MSYQIEPRKVAGVVVECNSALTNKGFNHGEVLVGLAELIGRTIVEISKTSIQADELLQVVDEHIKRTIAVGSQAQEKSLIERV